MSAAKYDEQVMIRARVIGCGIYLPPNIVTNDDLAKRVDTCYGDDHLRLEHAGRDGHSKNRLWRVCDGRNKESKIAQDAVAP